MIIQWQRKKYDFCDLARTNLGFFIWLAREIGQNLPILFGQKIPKFENFRARIYWDYGGPQYHGPKTLAAPENKRTNRTRNKIIKGK